VNCHGGQDVRPRCSTGERQERRQGQAAETADRDGGPHTDPRVASVLDQGISAGMENGGGKDEYEDQWVQWGSLQVGERPGLVIWN